MKLKMLGTAAVIALGLTACNDDSGNGSSENAGTNNEKTVSSIEFKPLALAANETEKKTMRVSDQVTVKYSDGSQKDYPLSYQTLAKMGDQIGSGVMGQMVDMNGQSLTKDDGSVDISDGPDGNSFFKVGSKYRLITHLEERPGQLMDTELELRGGKLVPVNTKPVDLSGIGGTIINCASSKTAYGSHLGGEENYSLNSVYADKASPFYVDCKLDGSGSDATGEFNYFCNYVDQQSKYFHDEHVDKNNGYNGDYFKPYNYGYIVEVQPQADGTTKSAKHYVTGSYTPELAVMMPDQKTVYMSDDGTAKGLWKFVSDEPIDAFKAHWSGTLYAAKVTQKSDQNGGEFDLQWIELGHGNDEDIKALIDQNLKLTDIFDIQAPDADLNCPSSYTYVYEDGRSECLKLKPGMETAAAFLESRKYAGIKGATLEFRKEEGLTFDPDRNALYIAMSAVEKSMEANYKGREKADHIHLPKESCGAVYEMTLDEHYSGTGLKGLVLGETLDDTDPRASEWYCNPDKIANPDNIKYIGHNILLIGEDTKKHVNNMVWAYDTQKGTLTRIASLPIGAEVTGLDVGLAEQKGVLFLSAQHPFKDNPKNRAGEKPNTALLQNATDEERKAFIGYIDGFPEDVLSH